jgi:hypothetical protein
MRDVSFGRWMTKRANLINDEFEQEGGPSNEFLQFVKENSHTPVYPLHTTKVSDLLSDEEILSLWTLQLSL